MSMTGTPWSWGYNAFGQLVNGNISVTVSGLNNVTAIVAGGDSHSLAFLSGGTIRAWSMDYGC